jgi:hypothetical protein
VTILDEISAERVRQDTKWGEQNHPIRPMNTRPFGPESMVAKRQCDIAHKAGRLSWYHILREEFLEVFAESDPAKQREELVQLAAVAVAMIECIDRRSRYEQ